ncbi:MAG TPA: hypothetical protein DCG49_11055 [Ruminococcus sp.]|nr:hypothetical protein [Ruminococcus sp.]
MTKETIKARLREMLSEIVEMDVNTIGDDDNFFDDLAFTSITVIQLFVSCQEEYGISMQEDVNLKNEITLNTIADLVLEKIEKQDAAKTDDAPASSAE